MAMRHSRRSPAAVEQEGLRLTADQRHHGARTVASMAKNAADCALLLAILGLDPAEGLTSETPPRGYVP